MTTIRRRKRDAYEEVEIPEGTKVCPGCKGKGSTTKYDRGWRSLTYSPSLDAPERCYWCMGKGYLEDDE